MSIFVCTFLRILCNIYLYQKLITKNAIEKINRKRFCISLFIIFISATIMLIYIPHFFIISYSLFFCIAMILIYKPKLDLSLIATMFTFVIFHSITSICSLLIALLCTPLYICEIQPSAEFLALISSILSFLCIYYIFKSKRLKAGITIITSSKYTHIWIITCLCIVAFKSIDTYQIFKENYPSYTLYGNFLPLITFLLAILLFAWWRRMITKSYIEKIRKLERQSLYDELAENAATIKKLREDNQALARILHKDNKLIPAMENAVTEFLLCRTSAELSEAKIYGEKLVAELQFMFQDRKGIMDDYDSQNVCLTQTGTVAVDAMLAYMQRKAASKQVVFTCKHTPAAMGHLLTRISPEDLSHLLSDLLENALNAMSDTNGGKLQVVLGKLEKDAYISVADTGTSFDIETLQLLGIQQHTTHADTGGSGIGLMDIWKLKKKYRASIQIQEFESQQNAYTKKITLFFNNKNHYVIQSYRHKEIINTQTRGDLYVIPAETIQVTEEFTHE